jgi:hypothetical protein
MSKRNPQRIHVYERKRGDKEGNPLPSFWYCRFRGEDGRLGSPLNTDQPNRETALQWAISFLAEKGVPSQRKPRPKSFAEWAAPWWLFASCPYVKYKQSRGFSISRIYVEGRRSYLENHLIPEFGNKLMSELRPWMFRDYSIRLFEEKKLTPSSINKILSTMRIMLTHACAMGQLHTNPMSAVGEPQPTDFIFWGATRERPINQNCILAAYKRALTRIGISPEEQKKRNLMFHSWRHGFNTYSRGKIPDEQLRRVTGHNSVAMTDRYDHPTVETLKDVRAMQEQLLTSEAMGEVVK